MAIYSIYKFTNLVNGKVYIGKTVQDPLQRKAGHVRDSTTSTFAFHRAIRKYGINSFKFEVILCTLDESSSSDYERLLIADHDCCTLGGSEKGYNMTRGGDGFDSETGRQNALAQIADGIHPFAGERGSSLQKKRVINGTHNLAGERGSNLQKKIQRAKVKSGTHHLQGKKGQALNSQRLAEGSHNFLTDHMCPHCGKEGKSASMFRWHFDKCKSKLD